MNNFSPITLRSIFCLTLFFILNDISSQTINIEDEKVYEVVEKQPAFKGNVNQWLSQNLRYPAAAEENGIEGKVIVQFVVEKDGSITNIKIHRSPNPLLDEEAIRLVSMMPRWSPGINNGELVRCRYILPISFKLN